MVRRNLPHGGLAPPPFRASIDGIGWRVPCPRQPDTALNHSLVPHPFGSGAGTTPATRCRRTKHGEGRMAREFLTLRKFVSRKFPPLPDFGAPCLRSLATTHARKIGLAARKGGVGHPAVDRIVSLFAFPDAPRSFPGVAQVKQEERDCRGKRAVADECGTNGRGQRVKSPGATVCSQDDHFAFCPTPEMLAQRHPGRMTAGARQKRPGQSPGQSNREDAAP